MFPFSKNLWRQPKTPESIERTERNELVSEIKIVRARMAEIEDLYNLTNDMDMIDYYIMESKALVARYRYLIRQVKAYDLRQSEVADIKG